MSSSTLCHDASKPSLNEEGPSKIIEGTSNAKALPMNSSSSSSSSPQVHDNRHAPPSSWQRLLDRVVPGVVVRNVEVLSVIAATERTTKVQLVRLKINKSDESADFALPPSVVVRRWLPGSVNWSDVPTSDVDAPHSAQSCREAQFFATIAPALHQIVPIVLYCGLDEDGSKVMVVEDFALRHGVSAGDFFGAYSPLNTTRDLRATTSYFVTKHRVDLRVTIKKCFEVLAELHGRHMRDEEILSESRHFLRSREWLLGRGRDTFWKVAEAAISSWRAFVHDPARCLVGNKATVGADQPEADRSGTVPLSPSVVMVDTIVDNLIENCFGKLNFEAYGREMLQRRGGLWTLVHGNAHPANYFLVDSFEEQLGGSSESMSTNQSVPIGSVTPPFNVVLADWENVGVGSGPQEVGHFMISHCPRHERLALEAEVLAHYHERLSKVVTARGLPPVSYNDVFAEYVEGGLCRWSWLLPSAIQFCSPSGVQYFHDQVRNFMQDHHIHPHELGMMRI